MMRRTRRRCTGADVVSATEDEDLAGSPREEPAERHYAHWSHENPRSPIVLVDGTAPRAELLATLASLNRHTPGMFRLSILDDRTRQHVDQDAELKSALPPGVLEPASKNSTRDGASGSLPAPLASPESDVIVIQAGALLPPAWLDRLRAVAYGDSVCASASALVTEGSPDESIAVERERREPRAFAKVIESPEWGAVYLRRDALSLTMWRLTADSLAEHPLLEALQTCLRAPGLTHRLASDVVVVLDRPSGRARSHASARPASENRITLHRRETTREIRVMIDARCLDRPLSGTQVHVLNLLKALSHTNAVALSILLPRRVDSSAEPYLAAIQVCDGHYTPDRLPGTTPAVFHRPYQFGTVEEVRTCREMAQRLVLTHQDMILDRTAAYHSSLDAWKVFRDATGEAFGASDQVGFFSRHAARDAAIDGLLPADKINVVPPGVDHPLSGIASSQSAFIELEGTPLLLVIGAARGHKNRVFALRLFNRLIKAHGWKGRLVLAGDHPQNGSSVPDEQEYLDGHSDTRDRVLDVGLVTDGQKQWLYENARLVLFPSLYEGFGLVPFEAAACGTPCVYGWRSALPEYLPETGAVLEGWDLDRCAFGVMEILEDENRSEGIVSAIQEAGSHLTWDATARAYIEVYRRALAQPATGLKPSERQLLDVYRGRALFRGAADAAIGSGIYVTKALRKTRAGIYRLRSSRSETKGGLGTPSSEASSPPSVSEPVSSSASRCLTSSRDR